MIQLDKDIAARIPINLIDSTGQPVAGVTGAAVTVTVQKANGAYQTIPVDGSNWFESTSGAFANSGTYDLLLPSSALDTEGMLKYAVAATGAEIYKGVLYVEPPTPAYVSFTGGGDTVSPVIARVVATRRTSVTVEFSESVVMTDAANGALNTVNYTIGGLTVSSVIQLSNRSVRLTTSPQTPGTVYTLTVSNIEDLDGNVIAVA